MSMLTAPEIIKQLNQARDLAFSNRETFPQVLRQILQFVNNPEIAIKYWCSTFLKDAFQSDDSVLGNADKIDLAIDSLDGLIALSNVEDLNTFKHVIDTSIVVYRLVFKYVNENDGCDSIWGKLNQLKISLTSKFTSTFPLPPSDTEEHDKFRNILSKVELIKFLVLVIDYQTKSNSNIDNFNLNFVNSNHSLIKKQPVQAEAFGLLDHLLNTFNNDILIPQLINPLLVQLTILVKRKNHFVPKILSVIEKFDTNDKFQSNYQTVEEYKLSKKYIDRVLRIFINHLIKYQLVPENFQQALNQKLTILTERGDEIRKKNIVAPSPADANIKKRKFEGFINGDKRLTTLDYKSLYCLTNPEDELNNFDLSALPQHNLISMTLAALNRVNPEKLNKALDIISERYKYALGNDISGNNRNFGPNGNKLRKLNNLKGSGVGDGDYGEDDIDDEELMDYDSKSIYNLPPPTELSFQDKREQIQLIIQNFFKLANVDVKEVEDINDREENGINKELTKIAIKNWKKNSWLIILTRLATRGMKSLDGSSSSGEHSSIDQAKNQELSDMIRTAIFDYFLENIHARIDVIIEWLNEEWYSEKVHNELIEKNKIKEKLVKEFEEGKNNTEHGDIDELVTKEFAKIEDQVDTPVYNKWTGKVLDSLIPFLEANDRKIFIRLLSDLPSLNEELISRIKSLCYDPARIKLGFLSLQYLIMYRPPVKAGCLNILQELSESDQQDLKEEASKLLAKYKQ